MLLCGVIILALFVRPRLSIVVAFGHQIIVGDSWLGPNELLDSILIEVDAIGSADSRHQRTSASIWRTRRRARRFSARSS